MTESAKKLALVFAISLLMIVASKEANSKIFNFAAKALPLLSLKLILCIYYLVWFKKNQAKYQALLNYDSKINAITPAYITKLGFKVRSTNIEAQKIDHSSFKTLQMVLASFQVEKKLRRVWFF